MRQVPSTPPAHLEAALFLKDHFSPGDIVLTDDPGEVNRLRYYAAQVGIEGIDVRCGTQLLRDVRKVKFMNNWGSAHPAGVMFLFVDGSVRLLPYETPEDLVQALLSPRGGEAVPDS